MIKTDAGEHPGKENGMTVQEMIARQRQITDQARSEGRDLTRKRRSLTDSRDRSMPETETVARPQADRNLRHLLPGKRIRMRRDRGRLWRSVRGSARSRDSAGNSEWTRTRLFPGETVLTRSGRLYWTSWKEMDRLFQSVLLRMQGTRNGLPWWTGSF